LSLRVVSFGSAVAVAAAATDWPMSPAKLAAWIYQKAAFKNFFIPKCPPLAPARIPTTAELRALLQEIDRQ
jgi:hypothetical protein